MKTSQYLENLYTKYILYQYNFNYYVKVPSQHIFQMFSKYNVYRYRKIYVYSEYLS